MKKTITAILTLVLVVATLMGTATTAFAYTVLDGTVSMDTVISENPRDGSVITVGDLFWTGSIGSAESSGTLDTCCDSVTWTLKDGVVVLKANPDRDCSRARVIAYVAFASPLWNNEHIETIIVDSEIYSLGGQALFTFGLPNLKTVIFLDDTVITTTGTVGVYGKVAYGDFPTDHEINYVWEAVNDGNGYGDKLGNPYAVGTSNNVADFATKNSFYTDRAAYLKAAAPVVANATLTQEAIDMLPADMIAAVNAIGGFKALGGNPATTGTTTQTIADGDVPATSTATATVASDISVTVNGTPVVWTDAAPFIDANNRTMVPLRAVADAMNLDVEWKADTRDAVFTRDDDTIIFTIGFKAAFSNLGSIAMDTEPVISNDRTYAPIRYLAEFFGYTVDWDAATRTVVITG